MFGLEFLEHLKRGCICSFRNKYEMSPPAGPHFVDPGRTLRSTAHDKRRRWRLFLPDPNQNLYWLLPNRLPIPLSRLAFFRPIRNGGRSPPPRAATTLRVPLLRVGAPTPRADHPPAVRASGGGGRRRNGRRRRDTVGRARRRLQRLLQLPPPGTFRSSLEIEISPRACCIIGLAAYSIPSRSRNLISFVM